MFKLKRYLISKTGYHFTADDVTVML